MPFYERCCFWTGRPQRIHLCNRHEPRRRSGGPEPDAQRGSTRISQTLSGGTTDDGSHHKHRTPLPEAHRRKIQRHRLPPKKTRNIAEARIKTDWIDSQALAELLRLNSLPESYMPPPDIAMLREKVRRRAFLVRQQS